jgi:hypothetical protein
MSENQREGSEGLPREWHWAWDASWVGVVRCARRKGLRGNVDVYLTDDGILVIDGFHEAAAAVVRAVLGVQP